jgi:hypothetical protein
LRQARGDFGLLEGDGLVDLFDGDRGAGPQTKDKGNRQKAHVRLRKSIGLSGT